MPAFEEWSRVAEVNPGRPSPVFVNLMRRLVRPLVNLMWRPSMEGTGNLPQTQPYILVANHSAGMGAAEIMSFGVMYLEEVGTDRPIAGFAHPMSFRFEPMKTLMKHAGAIPSTYEQAAAALESGIPLLIFPGGDHETTRPFWEANRVDFGGRQGFLRIAKKANVPVVPMGIQGAHHTAPVLFRSTRVLPKAMIVPMFLGVKRWPLMLLGLLGALAFLFIPPWTWPVKIVAAWLWMLSPLVFAPFVPWTIRFRIGKPIPPEELFPGTGDADLKDAYARVVDAVQTLVHNESDDSSRSVKN